MTYTLEELNEMMKKSGGSLDLRETQITSLPENLTVSGWIDLRGTQITSLPDNLTVGGWLYLRGTQITSLPDNLTVGGSLDLRGTQITNKAKEMRKVKPLKNGDYVPGKYLYADGILTHIKKERKYGEYTLYIGKIKGKNVVSDGVHYAHCDKMRDGIEDLIFKSAKDRGSEQYREYTMDSVVSLEEAKTMYRIITGACRAGTNDFVNGLPKVKKQYTVREMIDITKNAYCGDVFRDFFTKNGEYVQ